MEVKERIFLKPASVRAIKKIDFSKIQTANFTDDSEKYFLITAQDNNGGLRDIQIDFSGINPKIYISDQY